jgi:hypothetical protein
LSRFTVHIEKARVGARLQARITTAYPKPV